MKKAVLPRVVYCGTEDSFFKKLSKHVDDFVLEARSTTFSGSPQKFALAKKAGALILKVKNEFDLKHQEWLSKNDASVPVIILCQAGTIETAIHALQYGVFDYFCADQGLDVIVQRIKEAIAWRLTKPVKRLGESVQPLLLGTSPQIQKVNERACSLARESKPVLLYGEAGTGKEHLAYGIYQMSFRGSAPFVRYDCRLLQQLANYDGRSVPEIIHTRLQDLKKTNRTGVLFLSHMEQLGADQQREIWQRSAVSSLRLMGSFQEPSLNIFDERSGTSTAAIKIPALRQHKEDISMIAEHFIRHTAQRRKIRIKSISGEISMLMQEYTWPGNIQELSNLMERMMMVEPSGLLTANTWRICQGYGLKLNLDRSNQFSTMIEDALKSLESQWENGVLYQEFMEKMKKMLISLVLPKVGYNQVTAARILGISRNTLREQMK